MDKFYFTKWTVHNNHAKTFDILIVRYRALWVHYVQLWDSVQTGSWEISWRNGNWCSNYPSSGVVSSRMTLVIWRITTWTQPRTVWPVYAVAALFSLVQTFSGVFCFNSPNRVWFESWIFWMNSPIFKTVRLSQWMSKFKLFTEFKQWADSSGKAAITWKCSISLS